MGVDFTRRQALAAAAAALSWVSAAVRRNDDESVARLLKLEVRGSGQPLARRFIRTRDAMIAGHGS